MTDSMPPLRHPFAAEDPEGLAAARRAVYGDPPAPVDEEIGTYLGLLADALRARGARSREVAEVVGEVRSHCRSTGEDPVEAFGLPEDYASARFRPLSLRTVLARVGGGVLGAVGLGCLVLWLVPTFPTTPGSLVLRVRDLVFPFGFLLSMSVVPWIVYAVERRLLPRRLRSAHPTRGLRVLRVAVFLALVAVLLVVGPSPDPTTADRVVLSGPRWVFLVVGLLLVPLLALSVPGDRVVPRAPTAPGRRRGILARVRRPYRRPPS